MNKFDFHGKLNVDSLADSLDDAFALAAEIRRALGPNGHYLEKYLSRFLRGIQICADSLNQGGVNALTELRSLIVCAMNGEIDKSPFYSTVRNYIDTHPLAFQEWETQRAFYTAALFRDYLQYKAKEYRERLEEQLETIRTSTFSRQRKKIDDSIGPDAMKDLDLLLYKAFMPILPAAFLFQEMSVSLLFDLAHKDTETNRLMVELWLDAIDQ